jgi:hypothetical protein
MAEISLGKPGGDTCASRGPKATDNELRIERVYYSVERILCLEGADPNLIARYRASVDTITPPRINGKLDTFPRGLQRSEQITPKA